MVPSLLLFRQDPIVVGASWRGVSGIPDPGSLLKYGWSRGRCFPCFAPYPKRGGGAKKGQHNHCVRTPRTENEEEKGSKIKHNQWRTLPPDQGGDPKIRITTPPARTPELFLRKSRGRPPQDPRTQTEEENTWNETVPRDPPNPKRGGELGRAGGQPECRTNQ